MQDLLYGFAAIFTPIILYILAGFYAANAQWCWRKIFVALAVGIVIGIYGLFSGIEITDSWVSVAFNSAPALGAMYLADRVVKGTAKRYGIAWLYADKIEGENEEW